MLNRLYKLLLVLIMLALWGIALRPLLSLLPVQARSGATQTPKDNQELKQLCDEDQSDRTPPKGKSMEKS